MFRNSPRSRSSNLSRRAVARPIAVSPTIRAPSSRKCSVHASRRGSKRNTRSPVSASTDAMLAAFGAIALHACERQIFQRRFTPVLPGDDVIGFVREKGAAVGHQTVFAAPTRSLSNRHPERRRHRQTHPCPDWCASTSALMSETKRSTSHISSNSASSA